MLNLPGALWQDMRYGLRAFLRQPTLAATSTVVFALGIGLTTAMFSIVQGGLRELPFEDSHHLMRLERRSVTQGGENLGVPVHDYEAWRRQQTSFTDLAAFFRSSAVLNGDENDPARYASAHITANAFSILAVQPRLGRPFLPREESADAPLPVLLGHEVWRHRFGADPAILGRVIRVDGEAATVIGVMPAGFAFPVEEQIWLPLRLDSDRLPRGRGQKLKVFGRLARGVSLAQARFEFAAIARQMALDFPESNAGLEVRVSPYTEEYVGRQERGLLYTMLGAVFGVFLIACANVAHLLLARSVLRGREAAVRAALGASRRRLVLQFIGEALVPSAAGAALGLGLAAGGLAAFNRAIAALDPPFWIDIRLDLSALAFTCAITLLAALLAGALPAFQISSSSNAGRVLKDGAHGSSGRLSRLSFGLVVAEIALSCGLLIAAGLMIRTVVNLRAFDYGFASQDVFTARVALPEGDYPEAEDHHRFFEALRARLEADPEVRSAALASTLPTMESHFIPVALEGARYVHAGDRPVVRRVVVTPGFFSTFGVGLLEGRDFTSGDRRDAPPVALVNRSFAARFFPGASAVGRRLRLLDERGAGAGDAWVTIVGVVPDLHLGGIGARDPQGVYLPLAQYDTRYLTLVARTRGAPMAFTGRARAALASLDAHLPLYRVQSMTEVLRQNTWAYGVFGTLFMIFGAVALVLAATGLYGVMGFIVNRRAHEVGIRMALGAEAKDVLRLILRQGTWQLAAGLGLGLGLAVALAHGLRAMLFEVRPWDPATFLAILTALALTATAASLLPARRALTVDPVVTLRHD